MVDVNYIPPERAVENAIREQARQVRDAQRSTGTERNLVTQELTKTSQDLVETMLRLEETIAATNLVQKELLARSLKAYSLPDISITVLPSKWATVTTSVSIPGLDKVRKSQVIVSGVPSQGYGSVSVFATVTVAGNVVSREEVVMSPASKPADWGGMTYSAIGGVTLSTSNMTAAMKIDAYNFVGDPTPFSMTGISVSIIPS